MMAEPVSSTVSGITVATGAITLTGSIFGLQYDALLIGLFGGLIALMHLPGNAVASKVRQVLSTSGSLFTAAVMGALFSPVASAAALDYLNFTKALGPDVLRLAMACALGLISKVAIPLIFKLIEKKGAAA